jgi:ketosteroid isomerase-like protein
MVETSSRQRILEYLDACYSGDVSRADEFYDDDIDFICYAPVELFPALGQKRGKDALIESLVDRQTRFDVIDHRINFIAAERNKVAATLLLRLRQKASGRIISFDIGNFFTLRAGKIVTYRQFMDSFDVVQQVLGREIVSAIAKLGMTGRN